MSDVFPKWTNRLPRYLLVGSVILLACTIAAVAYYFTPQYTRKGYQPAPLADFSHKTHVAQAGLDCRYCHSTVETAAFASLPPASTCMNCHNQILRDDPRLEWVRQSATSNQPLPWIAVHRLPDYVHFNHAVHTRRGVGCVECHGDVSQSDAMRVQQPLSMAFCLECHRDPAPRLRPLDAVTDPLWQFSLPAATNLSPAQIQAARRSQGEQWVREWKIQPRTDCNTCHP
jgi:hypothetical protein